jgi:hypothetical protein
MPKGEVMGIRLIASALAAVCLPLSALADVSYTYTGNLFTDSQALVAWDGQPPDSVAETSAAAAAALLTDRTSFTFSVPVYIPQGWSSFSSTAPINGALAAPLTALKDGGYADPGVTWSGSSSLVADHGHVSLQPVPIPDPEPPYYQPPVITVSVHVGTNNQIDAWEISLTPGYIPATYLLTASLSSSSSSGDQLSYDYIDRHFSNEQQASNSNAGAWAVSGSPVAPVPEPAGYALMLAGLAAIGTLARRRRLPKTASRLIATTLTAAACLPLSAMADVSYTYTGNPFTDSHALVRWEDAPPESVAQASAAAAAALLTDRTSFTFSVPVYIPQGWSSFSSSAPIGGALAAPLMALQAGGYADPGVTWSGSSSLVGDSGHISLQPSNAPPPDDYTPAAISVSVHVDTNHQIDAWEISMTPGYIHSNFSLDASLSSSSANGDKLSYVYFTSFSNSTQDASNGNAGAWAVSGSPVAPVPEPAGYALMLAGLAAVGTLARHRRA